MSPRSPWKPTSRDGGFLLGLLVASLAIGWVANRLRAHPVPMPYVASGPSTIIGDLTLTQFTALSRAADALVVDARPELFFEVGHVPGAISLPDEDFAAAFPRLRARLQSARTIAVYCADADCEDARQLQANLAAEGLTQAAVFPEGWQGWTGAGLPIEKAQP